MYLPITGVFCANLGFFKNFIGSPGYTTYRQGQRVLHGTFGEKKVN